ncbi:MAG TPA: hypothetical protein VM031_01105, partial [Phycisphaerae bacterium]|nr:hypothetical protein [Phycisphaerae bacterium]
MSWQGLPATSDTDWAQWSFRAQFGKALYERGLACGQYSLPTPDYDTYQDGWDAHGLTGNAFSVKHIQAEIEAMISSFIRPVDWAG